MLLVQHKSISLVIEFEFKLKALFWVYGNQ